MPLDGNEDFNIPLSLNEMHADPLTTATSCTTQDVVGDRLFPTEEIVKASLGSKEAITLTLNTVCRSDPCRQGEADQRGPGAGGGARGASAGGLGPFAQFRNLPHLCLAHANEPDRKSRRLREMSQRAQTLSYFEDNAGENMFVQHRLLEGAPKGLSPPPPAHLTPHPTPTRSRPRRGDSRDRPLSHLLGIVGRIAQGANR